MAASSYPGATAPPRRVAAITPDDDEDLPFPCRAISFAAAGDIVVVTAGGDEETIPSGALAAGVQHSMQLTRIKATGTDATDIVIYA